MTAIQDRLKTSVPDIHWHMSAVGKKHESTFRGMIERVKPARIVEIGTHHGVSAALLAEYAPVTTVDIFPSHVREKTWRALGVADRITSHVALSSSDRDRLVSEAIAEADLAFVDGGHLMPDIVRDFDLCIPCGAVILHDYWLSDNSWPDVRDFVDGLDRSKYDVVKEVPFALVRAK